MTIFLRLAGATLCSMLVGTAHAAECLKYEPAVVTVSGELHRATFPGRPNFESIASGDEPETGFYLTLKEPLCTQADAAGEQEAQEGVHEVQLVLTQKQYAQWRPKLGQQVTLHGGLFAAFSGHHHAPVLLKVAD